MTHFADFSIFSKNNGVKFLPKIIYSSGVQQLCRWEDLQNFRKFKYSNQSFQVALYSVFYFQKNKPEWLWQRGNFDSQDLLQYNLYCNFIYCSVICFDISLLWLVQMQASFSPEVTHSVYSATHFRSIQHVKI